MREASICRWRKVIAARDAVSRSGPQWAAEGRSGQLSLPYASIVSFLYLFHSLSGNQTNLSGVGVFVVLALAADSLFAQSYPSKPVRVVVPFPAGGAVDVGMRAMGAKIGAAPHRVMGHFHQGGA